MAHTLPTRSQVDPANTWAITDLYPSDQAWREAYNSVRGLVSSLAEYRGRLAESAATLLAFLRLQDEIELQGDRVISYAFRKSDEDTRNAVYQEMSAQSQNLLVELSQALSFQTPELLAIEDSALEAFYAQEPALAHYRLMLSRIRSRKDHTLSPDGEALLASAERMGQAVCVCVCVCVCVPAGLRRADGPGPRRHLFPPQRRRHDLPRRGGRQGGGPPRHPRQLCRPAPVRRPDPARVRLPVPLRGVRPVPQHLRRHSGRPDEAAAVLCRRPALPLRPPRRPGRDRGGPPDLPQSDPDRPRQSGGHAPLCAPAQEAAGGGQAPLLRPLHPHCGRRGRRHPL